MRLVAGEGGDDVDGVKDDAGAAIVNDGNAIDEAAIAVGRGRGEFPDEFGREWANFRFPAWRKLASADVFFAQARREVAGAGVVALEDDLVLLAEVLGVGGRARVGGGGMPFPLSLPFSFGITLGE